MSDPASAEDANLISPKITSSAPWKCGENTSEPSKGVVDCDSYMVQTRYKHKPVEVVKKKTATCALPCLLPEVLPNCVHVCGSIHRFPSKVAQHAMGLRRTLF